MRFRQNETGCKHLRQDTLAETFPIGICLCDGNPDGKQTLPTCHDLASNALSNRALPSKFLLHEEFLGSQMATGGLPHGESSKRKTWIWLCHY